MKQTLDDNLRELINLGQQVLSKAQENQLNVAVDLENDRQIAMLNCVRAIGQSSNPEAHASMLQELLGINQKICLVLQDERDRIELQLSILAHGNHAVSEYLNIRG